MENNVKTTEERIKDIEHSIDLSIKSNAQRSLFDKWVNEIDFLRELMDRILANKDWDRTEILAFLYGKAKARVEACVELEEKLNELENEIDDK